MFWLVTSGPKVFSVVGRTSRHLGLLLGFCQVVTKVLPRCFGWLRGHVKV